MPWSKAVLSIARALACIALSDPCRPASVPGPPKLCQQPRLIAGSFSPLRPQGRNQPLGAASYRAGLNPFVLGGVGFFIRSVYEMVDPMKNLRVGVHCLADSPIAASLRGRAR